MIPIARNIQSIMGSIAENAPRTIAQYSFRLTFILSPFPFFFRGLYQLKPSTFMSANVVSVSNGSFSRFLGVCADCCPACFSSFSSCKGSFSSSSIAHPVKRLKNALFCLISLIPPLPRFLVRSPKPSRFPPQIARFPLPYRTSGMRRNVLLLPRGI